MEIRSGSRLLLHFALALVEHGMTAVSVKQLKVGVKPSAMTDKEAETFRKSPEVLRSLALSDKLASELQYEEQSDVNFFSIAIVLSSSSLLTLEDFI